MDTPSTDSFPFAQSFETLDSLPIHSQKQAILDAVDHNQVTIITAETGAGKSTQVPQYLAEHGYNKIIVTQPRILAARNLSTRVRQEYSWRRGADSSRLVGFRTAQERDDDPENVILYCTDGLQLVRELTGNGSRDRQILILDEIHEWNENMEVLVAWAKKRCSEDPGFKVVLMSATIEAGSLAAYYNAPAPISVPGRSFGVEKRHGSDLIAEIIELFDKQACNMLVFLPGKSEIENVGAALKSRIPADVPILPLHSQLDVETQQRVFGSYPQGKVILSTNVAQTSITIDDIDVVIDSGLERRAEVRDNVEGLFMAEVSQADCLQRAGRAGRTKAGLYILAQLDTMPCSPLEERPEYGVPEILRKHVDRVVLRLANIGIDIEDLDFYHPPSQKAVKLAKRTLVSLGAMTASGEVTAIGQHMERFPVESSYARMLVEADSLPPELQAKLVAIIAIQEVGGIVKGSPHYTKWRRFVRQSQSDLVAQYELYLALSSINEIDYEDFGIIGKNVSKAEDVMARLRHSLHVPGEELAAVDASELDSLLRCIVAGQLHQIWLLETGSMVVGLGTKKRRELSSSSVVKHAGIIVGTPFDLQVTGGKGLETLHLVNQVTVVNPQWLTELDPERFQIRRSITYFDSAYGTLATKDIVQFQGRTFEAAGTPNLDRTQQNKDLFIAKYSSWLHDKVEKERQTVEIVNHRRLPAIKLRQVEDRVRGIAYGAVSLLELDKSQRVELHKLSTLAAYLDESLLETLDTRSEAPENRHGKHRRWFPGRGGGGRFNRRRDRRK